MPPSCTPHLTTSYGPSSSGFMGMHFLLTYVHVFVGHNECLHSSGVHDACKGTGAELYHVKEPPLIKEQLKNRPGSLL